MREKIHTIDWTAVQAAYDSGDTTTIVCSRFSVSQGLLRRARESGLFKPRSYKDAGKLGHVLHPERAEAAGLRAAERYRLHPEQHPIAKCCRNRGSWQSYPEALAHRYFMDNGFQFEPQFRVDRFWTDFMLTDRKLVVEIDGARWHDAERDAARDAIIRAAGYDIIRFAAKSVVSQLNLYFGTNWKMPADFTAPQCVKRLMDPVAKVQVTLPKCTGCGKAMSAAGRTRCPVCRRQDDLNAWKSKADEILDLLQRHDYNLSAAGRECGISSSALIKRCRYAKVDLPKQKQCRELRHVPGPTENTVRRKASDVELTCVNCHGQFFKPRQAWSVWVKTGKPACCSKACAQQQRSWSKSVEFICGHCGIIQRRRQSSIPANGFCSSKCATHSRNGISLNV